MNARDVVMSAGSSGAGQGYAELAIAVISGLLCVGFLALGVVVRRRDGGRPRVWFGLAAAAFVVGALALALA